MRYGNLSCDYYIGCALDLRYVGMLLTRYVWMLLTRYVWMLLTRSLSSMLDTTNMGLLPLPQQRVLTSLPFGKYSSTNAAKVVAIESTEALMQLRQRLLLQFIQELGL